MKPLSHLPVTTTPPPRKRCAALRKPKAKASRVLLPFYGLGKLAGSVRALLPDWLTRPQRDALAGRIERFLAGFATVADFDAGSAAMPVPIPYDEFLVLRRQWLALAADVCGKDAETRRRFKERVRDFFKRNYKPIR